MADHIAVVSAAIMELIEEDEEEEEKDDKKSDAAENSSTEHLVPQKVPAPWATVPMAPGFWAWRSSDEVTERGLATSSRAWGKVPAA